MTAPANAMPDSLRAARAHWLPFAVWLAGILLLQMPGIFGATVPRDLAPLVYAIKSLLCAGLLLGFKPWRCYRRVCASDWLPSLAAGLLVTALWVIPETPWMGRWWPAFQTFYHRWLILPPGRFPAYFDPAVFPALPFNHPSLAFSPAETGWPLTIVKLAGSAFVIAVIEEYFFRGFLYRWLRERDFLRVNLAHYDRHAFWIVVLVFGLEHDRWLAGMAAGAVYGWLAVRRGRLAPPIIAHVTTNLALGMYVILSDQYGFW